MASVRCFVALVAVGGASVASAGTITSVQQIELNGRAGATHNQSTPFNPAAGQVQSLTATQGTLQTWLAGSWNNSGLDAWYATANAANSSMNSGEITFNGYFAATGNYDVQFTPELAGGFAASGLSVLVSSGFQQVTLTSTQTTGTLLFLTNSFTVTFSIAGDHNSPFNTTAPRVGGTIAFARLLGDEEGPMDPVPGIGVAAAFGLVGLARRRRTR